MYLQTQRLVDSKLYIQILFFNILLVTSFGDRNIRSTRMSCSETNLSLLISLNKKVGLLLLCFVEKSENLSENDLSLLRKIMEETNLYFYQSNEIHYTLCWSILLNM